ncbi:hypothetical protein COY28_04810 [Candidatus Woesearchaeota archaeon CG_4_10_14_0_2_um_filter_57_5]|nr:MAG: hypothetical protein AUJ68_06960 [Candidatus Woesearchaeota archaeon CG1_02_57_44]PIZ51813.1 MAG: hypothetical protein COY28_04810 [Candidatus Woesearchaeota archaeon CG_4_10_14_0_2_um_filter_57_5]
MDLVIVDEHNMVLAPWLAVPVQAVLHLDYHSDMYAMDVPLRNGGSDATYARKVSCAEFICPAVHYGGIASVAHVLLHEARVDMYTDLHTREQDDGLYWASPCLGFSWRVPTAYRTGLDTLTIDATYILDIDLDAFMCMEESDYDPPSALPDSATQRIGQMRGILSELPEPQLVTIAQSAHSGVFTPAAHVGMLQERVVAVLRELYGDALHECA